MPGYTGETPTAVVIAWLRGSVTFSLSERMVNARTVLSEYPGGPLVAAQVLDKLEAAAQSVSAVKWVQSFLKADVGIDIASAATRTAIDALIYAEILTPEEGAALKGLGEREMTRWDSVGGRASDEDGYVEQVVAGVRGWV
ncbi:MAG: hypothetical protein IT530_16035 [Burkholderiales bacterium]|nr:hypothetical protein [Burkholderiales bacterium]